MAHCLGKQLGKSIKVSNMTKYLCSSRLNNEVLQNYESNHRLYNCIVFRMEEKKVNRYNSLVILLKYKDFKTNDGEQYEIYSVIKWCNKKEERRPSNVFFDTDNVNGRASSLVSVIGRCKS